MRKNMDIVSESYFVRNEESDVAIGLRISIRQLKRGDINSAIEEANKKGLGAEEVNYAGKNYLVIHSKGYIKDDDLNTVIAKIGEVAMEVSKKDYAHYLRKESSIAPWLK